MVFVGFVALHKEILPRGMVIILDIKDFPLEQTRGIIIVVFITHRLSKCKMQPSLQWCFATSAASSLEAPLLHPAWSAVDLSRRRYLRLQGHFFVNLIELFQIERSDQPVYMNTEIDALQDVHVTPHPAIPVSLPVGEIELLARLIEHVFLFVLNFDRI